MKAGRVADYTVSAQQGAWLAGTLVAKMSRSGTLGIGEPPAWNAQAAAFVLGTRAARSAIKIRYAVIGPAAYSDAAGGKRVTASVIAAGADVIFGEGNGTSFGMLQAVETTPAQDGNKVWFIDVIGDKSPIDKGHLLSSVLWNLTPVYTAMIRDLKNNQFGSYNCQTSLANGAIGLLKTPHIPDDIWAQVQAVRDRIISGEITVPADYDASTLHALLALGIGTVFQHPMLVPTLTLTENLALGDAWWRPPARRRYAAAIARLGTSLGVTVDPCVSVSTLSLGEQQQAEILRAVLRGSRVLILDEPTALLTPQDTERLGLLMRRLVAQGLAVVFITHTRNEALAWGDRLSVLRRGRKGGRFRRRACRPFPRRWPERKC